MNMDGGVGGGGSGGREDGGGGGGKTTRFEGLGGVSLPLEEGVPVGFDGS